MIVSVFSYDLEDADDGEPNQNRMHFCLQIFDVYFSVYVGNKQISDALHFVIRIILYSQIDASNDLTAIITCIRKSRNQRFIVVKSDVRGVCCCDSLSDSPLSPRSTHARAARSPHDGPPL